MHIHALITQVLLNISIVDIVGMLAIIITCIEFSSFYHQPYTVCYTVSFMVFRKKSRLLQLIPSNNQNLRKTLEKQLTSCTDSRIPSLPTTSKKHNTKKNVQQFHPILVNRHLCRRIFLGIYGYTWIVLLNYYHIFTTILLLQHFYYHHRHQHYYYHYFITTATLLM